MAIELLHDHVLDGETLPCVKWDCSCGKEMVIPFMRVRNRQVSPCPDCGCCRSFSSAIIEKFENELKG